MDNIKESATSIVNIDRKMVKKESREYRRLIFRNMPSSIFSLMILASDCIYAEYQRNAILSSLKSTT